MPETVELEGRLAGLRADIDWPATPALAARVRAQIAAPAPVRRAWFQTQWALAAAVALVVLAALLAYPPSREAIANWLNLHTTITRVDHLPTPSPQPSSPIGKRLGLGEPTTLAEAQSKVAWKILVPASLGPPDEVYLLLPPLGPPGGEVTLVYKARPGMKASGQTGVAVLITEADGRVDANFFGKVIGNGTTVEEVAVDRRPAACRLLHRRQRQRPRRDPAPGHEHAPDRRQRHRDPHRGRPHQGPGAADRRLPVLTWNPARGRGVWEAR